MSYQSVDKADGPIKAFDSVGSINGGLQAKSQEEHGISDASVSRFNILPRILKYFKVEERGTSVPQELRGGCSTFLTMSYSLLVNPHILSKMGLPMKDVVIGTAVSSGVASIIAGAMGNLPLGLSPGVGLSAYLAYGLVLSEVLTIGQAFTASFLAGVLLCLLSATGLANRIINIIPKSVKLSTVVGMGFQIALIGLTSVNIVVADEETIVGLGPLSNPHMWYALAGLLIIGTLIYHRVPGSILIGIVVLTIFTWSVERDFPKEYVMLPEMHQNLYPIFRKEDFTLEMIPAVLSFLFIGLVDVSVTTFGMSAIAGLVREDGEVDGSVFSFWGCGLGSIVGSLMGSAPIIVYVESAAGIKEGARTGISAIMVGLLFFIAIFLAPVLGAVPQTATAPVAILVGTMMMSEARNLDWDDMSEAIPAFLTLAVMPFTFSITNGLAFGLGAALFFYISTGKMFFDIKKMYVKCKGRFTPLPTTKPTEESQLL